MLVIMPPFNEAALAAPQPRPCHGIALRLRLALPPRRLLMLPIVSFDCVPSWVRCGHPRPLWQQSAMLGQFNPDAGCNIGTRCSCSAQHDVTRLPTPKLLRAPLRGWSARSSEEGVAPVVAIAAVITIVIFVARGGPVAVAADVLEACARPFIMIGMQDISVLQIVQLSSMSNVQSIWMHAHRACSSCGGLHFLAAVEQKTCELDHCIIR